MTLRRLVDGEGTAFERELLASARADQVPAGARSRVGGRLGFVAGEMPHAEVQSRGAIDQRSGHAGPASAKSAGARLAQVGKYGVIALIGGAAAMRSLSGDGQSVLPSSLQAPTPAAEPAIAAVELARPPAENAPLLPEGAALPKSAVTGSASGAAAPADVRSAPSVTQRQRAARAPALNPRPVDPVASEGASTLMLEVVELDTARAALSAGENQRALDQLDGYRARFPQGELSLEASVLRVRALAGAGRGAQAARLARDLMKRPGTERYRTELGRIAGARPP